MALIEGDVEVDVESGMTSSEEEGIKTSFPGGGQGRKQKFSRSSSGFLNLNQPVWDSCGIPMRDSSETTRDDSGERIELLVERNSGGEERQELASLLEKKSLKDQKKHNSKKPPKPPLPPKGPILSASDAKLVREISELAAKRRARVERMRALRKMKAVKRSAWSSNLTALVITILFFVIVILQGVRSRHVGFQGSPEPAVATEGLISMQFYSHAPSNELANGAPSISRPPSYLEQATGSVPCAEEGREVG